MKSKMFFNLLNVFCLLFIASQSFAQLKFEKGNGNVVKEDRKIESFSRIICRNSINLYLTQGEEEKITIEADDNLMELIITEVKDQSLEIYLTKTVKEAKKLNVYVTFKTISMLQNSGATTTHSQNKIKADNFQLNTSGASDVKLDLEVNNLVCDISGASVVKLKGSANLMNVEVSGASDFSAGELVAQTCNVSASGASNAFVTAIKAIEMDESGVSNISYSGTASNTKKNGSKINVKVTTED